MRKSLIPILILALCCSVATATPQTVRQRMQDALDKTIELRSKAVAVDPEMLKRAALRPEESLDLDQHADFSGAVFATSAQVRGYDTYRPWAKRYAPTWYHPARCFAAAGSVSVSNAFSAVDVPLLRKLLADKDAGIRSLAIQALAVFDQPQDVPAIASMMDDSSPGAPSLGFNEIRSATFFRGMISADSTLSPDVERSWRETTVGDYARQAVEHMTGLPDCYPSLFERSYQHGLAALDSEIFAKWWKTHGNARKCLWYWRQRAVHGLREVDFRLEPSLQLALAGGDANAWKSARDRQRKSVIAQVYGELAQQPPEVEAKVKLLMWGQEWESGLRVPPDTVLQLRLGPERLLELLEQKDLWQDVDWNSTPHCPYNLMAERIGLNTRILRRQDVSRIRAVLDNDQNRLYWSGRSALLVCISRLLPAAELRDLDNPDTRDGTLRLAMRSERDVFVKGLLARELVRVGLPANWSFLREQFFSEANGNCMPDMRTSIVEALGEAPLSDAKRKALIDLVTDQRFRPLWIRYNAHMGDDACRNGAVAALNTYAGRELITDQDKQALVEPATSEATLASVLEKVRSLATD